MVENHFGSNTTARKKLKQIKTKSGLKLVLIIAAADTQSPRIHQVTGCKAFALDIWEARP
ncbi:hypothetical protein [Rhodoluna lacicola]|jgi:hypothetical protein|uniref:hypothetical protein n=1 Tax=Rhodoluna lacicola TaxID=529884 RepID=UPI00068B3D7E|nr:hypothetical protein [Rhodoluna lacicola]